jgi:cell shape-determining protein MreD
MKISFFIFLTFFLTIIQTAAFPDFFLSNHFFDLLIIIILYLGLVFKHPAIIFVLVLIGFIVDSVSGVYFGLYLTTYIWIYIIVQALKLIVFSRNIVFYLVIAATAVAIESIFLILSVFINQGKSGVASLNYYFMLKQMFLACIFIPLALVIITFIQKKYEIFVTSISSKIKRNSDYYN